MASLADVARRAQVSKATASRVLNGLGKANRISPQTVLAVEEAARALGYPGLRSPSPRPRSRTIGLVVGSRALIGAGSDYTQGVVAGVTGTVRTGGYHLLLNHERHQWEALGIDLLADRRVDALITFAWILTPGLTLIDLEALALPMVVVGDPPRPTRRPVVALDYAAAYSEAFEALATLGHRRLGWIAPTGNKAGEDRQTPSQREAAICDLARIRGMDLRTCLLSSHGSGETTRDTVIQGHLTELRARLGDLDGCTALLCYNDLLAIALLRVLQERGEEVPRDRSVIGFDDVLADVAIPPLSTISHRCQDLGSHAAAIALELAGDPARQVRWAGRRETVAARFLRGATLGAAHR